MATNPSQPPTFSVSHMYDSIGRPHDDRVCGIQTTATSICHRVWHRTRLLPWPRCHGDRVCPAQLGGRATERGVGRREGVVGCERVVRGRRSSATVTHTLRSTRFVSTHKFQLFMYSWTSVCIVVDKQLRFHVIVGISTLFTESSSYLWYLLGEKCVLVVASYVQHSRGVNHSQVVLTVEELSGETQPPSYVI